MLVKWSKASRKPPGWSGLEHTSCAQGLREWGSFSLEQGWFWGASEQLPCTCAWSFSWTPCCRQSCLLLFQLLSWTSWSEGT